MFYWTLLQDQRIDAYCEGLSGKLWVSLIWSTDLNEGWFQFRQPSLRRRLYNCSKIRAVNDSVRVLRETFSSRGVVKLFTTLIRRYNGAASGIYRPFETNERTNGDLGKDHLSTAVDRYLGDSRQLYKDVWLC